jgi:hypothetical protein
MIPKCPVCQIEMVGTANTVLYMCPTRRITQLPGIPKELIYWDSSICFMEDAKISFAVYEIPPYKISIYNIGGPYSEVSKVSLQSGKNIIMEDRWVYNVIFSTNTVLDFHWHNPQQVKRKIKLLATFS